MRRTAVFVLSILLLMVCMESRVAGEFIVGDVIHDDQKEILMIETHGFSNSLYVYPSSDVLDFIPMHIYDAYDVVIFEAFYLSSIQLTLTRAEIWGVGYIVNYSQLIEFNGVSINEPMRGSLNVNGSTIVNLTLDIGDTFYYSMNSLYKEWGEIVPYHLLRPAFIDFGNNNFTGYLDEYVVVYCDFNATYNWFVEYSVDNIRAELEDTLTIPFLIGVGIGLMIVLLLMVIVRRYSRCMK